MTDNQHSADDTEDAPSDGRHTAGAFDIRNFIGGLLGIYGVILTLMGLFGDQELNKTGGWNANLYTGLALLVVSAFFVTWARVKPTVVPAHVEPPVEDETRPGPTVHPPGR
ncbi:hypothetical protein BA895_03660 [Humibacillus sp. DSM 29435]|uniref:hypothetical protein n=1 Tax=Humibacillus sp. DSM 29435 TaxID=1869167 RepID=UPI000871E367|nr:hypothetical protein [Humibacillus sp. DSM 29435]OFE16687.1 hypothetical protein BA895_03660 [Humibacillus sp. DSM 29435]